MRTSRPRRTAFLAILALSLAAVRSLAQGEDESDFEVEVLSAAERKQRELQRLRGQPPVLACAPSSLRATVKRQEPKELRLTIKNVGGRTLNWELKSAPGWLRIDRRSGALGFEGEVGIALTINPVRLPEGRTREGIVIEAPGAAGSPVTIPIVVEVKPVPQAGPVKKTTRKPAAQPGRPTAVPRDRRRRRLTARAGVLMPGTAEEISYESGFLAGVSYDLSFRRAGALSFEAAAELGQASGSSGEVKSDIAVLSAAARFAPGARSLYLVGVGSVVLDSYADELYDLKGFNVIPMVGVGAGLRPPAGRWDARFTYSALLGSENVGGLALLTAGIVF